MINSFRKRNQGFTLAELLIALTILGEIATFTIPKILSSQTNSRNNAIAKETMGTLTGAYQGLQFSGASVATSTTAGALSQYMNYVAADTSSSVDGYPAGGSATYSCASYTCVRLHNGGLLLLDTIRSFGTTTGYVDVVLDPDGTVTSNRDSILFILSYNGKIQDYGNYLGSTTVTPSWFSY